jgi:hypothetical protein
VGVDDDERQPAAEAEGGWQWHLPILSIFSSQPAAIDGDARAQRCKAKHIRHQRYARKIRSLVYATTKPGSANSDDPRIK